MSTTELTDELTSDETPERAFLVRTYAAELTAGDGRTVDVRIVPYGETATVSDGFGGAARGVPYTEQWMPGVFDHQVNAANRVLVNFEHQAGLAGVVGHGVELRDASDGFYGSLRVHDNADGEKALMLVREKVLASVSLEAVPVKNVRTAAGIVQRVKAHLRAVALCREGAYTGAQVLAVREAPILDEELLPVDLDADAVERCRRLGIRLPQRYEAHPAEPDTPSTEGTSDAAPVEDTENSTTEEHT